MERAAAAQTGAAYPAGQKSWAAPDEPQASQSVGGPGEGRGRKQPSLTSLPLVAPPSHHSTVTQECSKFTTFTVALWIKPGKSQR